jgi:hypothetical protein
MLTQRQIVALLMLGVIALAVLDKVASSMVMP